MASTRTSLCPDVDFPVLETDQWESSGHLLTLSELIGGIRGKISRKVSAEEACHKIAKIVVQHWINRNEYPISWQNLQQRLIKVYSESAAVRKLIMKGSYTEATNTRYNALKEIKDKVYDIYSLHSDHPNAK